MCVRILFRISLLLFISLIGCQSEPLKNDAKKITEKKAVQLDDGKKKERDPNAGVQKWDFGGAEYQIYSTGFYDLADGGLGFSIMAPWYGGDYAARFTQEQKFAFALPLMKYAYEKKFIETSDKKRARLISVDFSYKAIGSEPTRFNFEKDVEELVRESLAEKLVP